MRRGLRDNVGRRSDFRRQAQSGGVQAAKRVLESAWSENYSTMAAADKLDETARRLQIKTKQLANRRLSVEQKPSLAAQKMQIERQDVLNTALRQMQAASAAELYSEAARLRDESLAWLDGWWKPVSTGQRVTSLLHVSNKSHGRWTGRLFSAVDFIHYDMNRQQQAGAQIDMQQMLRDPRYGTALFEVFILPAAAAGSCDGRPGSQPGSSSSSVDGSSSPCSSMSEESITSSLYASLVVALQSANRALNELLQVPPTAVQATANSTSSSVSSTSGQPDLKPVNQRILLLLWRHTAAAVAVQAGNDQTLWVWNNQPSSQPRCITTEAATTATTANTTGSCNTDCNTSTSDIQQTSKIASPSVSQQRPTSTRATAAVSSAVSQPTRPAECCTGALIPTFSVDWHQVDLLRGPGSIKRTDQNRFKFTCSVLPVDVPISIATNSNSNSNSSSSSSNCGSVGGQKAQLFRVDLQYLVAASPHLAGGSNAACTAAAAAAPVLQLGNRQPDWAVRVAHQVQQLVQQQQFNPASDWEISSGSSRNGEDSMDSASAVADLLAAAAVGSAPAGGWVSEMQRPVTVTAVDPLSSSSTAAATMDFERIIDDLVVLSFGGWEVAAQL